jgi:hypothetical protein
MAVIATRTTEPTYPAGSTPHAVTTYLRLRQEGKVDAAYTMTAFADDGVTRDDFHAQWDNWGQTSHSVRVVVASTRGNSAGVTVAVSDLTPGPFVRPGQEVRQTFTLARKQDVWRVTGPSYPYLLQQ